jgi:ABC-type branched-subunit amino acid transport system ATPase component
MPTLPAEAQEEMTVSALFAGYGSTTIVHGIDFTARLGQAVAIIGPNGAGKSTFVKAIAGAIPTMSGTVALGGRDITHLRGDQLARLGIGYVPQIKDVFASLSVSDNLEMGGYILPRRAVAAAMERIFDLFPTLVPLRRRTAGTLSGGERKLLALGKALMTSPKIMLLDEPTANLSPDLARVVLTEHVRRLVDEGMGVVLVEQRAKEALRICERAYVLTAGTVRVAGRSEEILANEDIGTLFLGGAANLAESEA